MTQIDRKTKKLRTSWKRNKSIEKSTEEKNLQNSELREMIGRNLKNSNCWEKNQSKEKWPRNVKINRRKIEVIKKN